MLVAAVLFGVNFRCVAHKALSTTGMCLREEREMGGLGVIAEIVALGCQLMEVSSRSMLFGGFQVKSSGGMASHETLFSLSL